jgi:ABC-2 type transport system ATP-binding protein
MTDRPHMITIRSSDDRKLATTLMSEPVVFAVELTPTGLSVQTAQLGVFRSRVAGASRSAGVRLLEVVSSDESLESVFDYLVRR